MFALEGHEVHIIDNLSTGSSENAKFSHVFYQVNAEDPKCEEIFKKFKFDVVIHLAAQVNVAISMEDPYIDSKYNVLGISNMLKLARKYGVNKVVFASSAAVYGMNEEIPLKEESKCDPVSPYGMNKWVGEIYCEKWNEIFGLDTLCYRFSNVYGPRQGTIGEGGVVSIFIQRIVQGKDLTIFGDGEQSRDFIYVQDVAEAIYRGVEKDLSGIYNLSTNTGISVNQLIETLGEFADIKNVNYENERQGDIKHSRLDNTKIKRDLDWEPFHTYKEGLAKTYHWFNENINVPKKEKKKREIKLPEWLNKYNILLPYLENIGLFVLVYLINVVADVHYYMVDYQLVYIIMASFLFSKTQSFLSIGMATVWFVAENISLGRDIITLLIDPSTLVHVSVYIFAGVIIRYVLDKKEALLENYQNEAAEIKEKYQFLHTTYEDAMKVKEELQKQILYTDNSVGTVSRMMKDLNSLEPHEIYESSVHIVENILKTKKVAFYIFNISKGELTLQHTSEHFEPMEILEIEHNVHFKDVLKNGKTFVNKTLEEGPPSVILPVRVNGAVSGVICVEGLRFEQLSIFYINMLNTLGDLISSSLNCAYEYQHMLENQGINNQVSNKVIANV